jgi:putative Mn2+ efflux pump MntP
MKNIKDITISIFAIIGFVAILSSFNNQSQETHSTPESHIWELSNAVDTDRMKIYKINKVTGEVFYIVKDKASLVEKK